MLLHFGTAYTDTIILRCFSISPFLRSSTNSLARLLPGELHLLAAPCCRHWSRFSSETLARPSSLPSALLAGETLLCNKVPRTPTLFTFGAAASPRKRDADAAFKLRKPLVLPRSLLAPSAFSRIASPLTRLRQLGLGPFNSPGLLAPRKPSEATTSFVPPSQTPNSLGQTSACSATRSLPCSPLRRRRAPAAGVAGPAPQLRAQGRSCTSTGSAPCSCGPSSVQGLRAPIAGGVPAFAGPAPGPRGQPSGRGSALRIRPPRRRDCHIRRRAPTAGAAGAAAARPGRLCTSTGFR